MVKQILVVKRGTLFPNSIFTGFISNQNSDLMDKILINHEYVERNDRLENNASFLQIIPYLWIINKRTQKVFLYQRAPGLAQYSEKRHIEKYSGGLGGHIDKEEIELKDPITETLQRELREEVIMKEYPDFVFVGFVHGEDDIYEKVHLGVVAISETTHDVQCTDDGGKNGNFYSVNEVDDLLRRKDIDFDKWTRASWPFIKKQLLS